jgi:hypothetical protein
MYSDSPDVVDALAQLVEKLIADAVENPVPPDRMNQVRHIIQVDESHFQARFSLDQLKIIEMKEMEAIVGEIVSAVGLQRFRFLMRQSAGTLNSLEWPNMRTSCPSQLTHCRCS